MNIPRWNKWKMKWLLSQIRQSDDSEIVMILNEIITRYHALDPNTDVVFLSLPKNDLPQRERILSSLHCSLKEQDRP